jgi:hypothetical protein
MQAAAASGAAISKTTIKKITLVLNRRTQRAILFSSALLDPRTRAEKCIVPDCKEKPRSPEGTRLQCDTRPS